MKNYKQRGEVLDFVVPAAGVKSGDLVIAGALVGVAVCDGVKDDVVAVNLTGVYELLKANVAITQGAAVYWDATNKNVTTTAAGNTLIGNAMNAEIAAATTVQVRIKN